MQVGDAAIGYELEGVAPLFGMVVIIDCNRDTAVLPDEREAWNIRIAVSDKHHLIH